MRILFDQDTPAPLRHRFAHHDVTTAHELGWSTLTNGELLAAAEDQGYQVLVTTDTNLKYQQNLAARRIAVVVLGTTSWPRIRSAVESVIAVIDAAARGSYAEIAIP